MDRIELIKILTVCLRRKFKRTQYQNNEILDVRVNIEDEYDSADDYCMNALPKLSIQFYIMLGKKFLWIDYNF